MAAGVLVMAGLIAAVVLTQSDSVGGSGTDAVAGVAETSASEALDPVAWVSGTAPAVTDASADPVEVTSPPATEAPTETVAPVTSPPATEAPAPTVTVPPPDALFPVRVDGLYGFIDRSGALVIETKYEDADTFSQGLAPVMTADGWGYINMSGEWVIHPRPEFNLAFSFSEDLAAVETDDGWGYIDGTDAGDSASRRGGVGVGVAVLRGIGGSEDHQPLGIHR